MPMAGQNPDIAHFQNIYRRCHGHGIAVSPDMTERQIREKIGNVLHIPFPISQMEEQMGFLLVPEDNFMERAEIPMGI